MPLTDVVHQLKARSPKGIEVRCGALKVNPSQATFWHGDVTCAVCKAPAVTVAEHLPEAVVPLGKSLDTLPGV